MGPKSKDKCPDKGHWRRDRKKAPVKTEAELHKGCSPQPRSFWSHRKLLEAGEDPPLDASEGALLTS